MTWSGEDDEKRMIGDKEDKERRKAVEARSKEASGVVGGNQHRSGYSFSSALSFLT